MDHKDQHYIPRSYLKPWCDPSTPDGHEPYVWKFSKDGSQVCRKPPRKIFSEKDMYTIRLPGGTRDLRLEHGLGELEDKCTRLRDEKLEMDCPLDTTDRLILSLFVAAMYARTRARVAQVRNQWQPVVDLAARIRQRVEESPELASAWAGMPSHGAKITLEEVQELVAHPAQTSLVPTINTMGPHLFEMDVRIFVAGDVTGFITSDVPCVLFDPQARSRPRHLRSPDIESPEIEVTMPISPRRLVVFNRQGYGGIVKVPVACVDELNRRTRFHAQEHFVVCANTTRPIWFVRRESPKT